MYYLASYGNRQSVKSRNCLRLDKVHPSKVFMFTGTLVLELKFWSKVMLEYYEYSLVHTGQLLPQAYEKAAVGLPVAPHTHRLSLIHI